MNINELSIADLYAAVKFCEAKSDACSKKAAFSDLVAREKHMEEYEMWTNKSIEYWNEIKKRIIA